MQNSFEILIPVAENDIFSLKQVIPYILKFIPANKFVIVGPECIFEKLSEYPQLVIINENSVLDGMTFDKLNTIIGSIYPKAMRRTGWYYQQFIKYAYARICKTNYYLTWDSDTFPLCKLDLFDDKGNPIMDYIPKVKGDSSYFRLLQILWPKGEVIKQREESFITEHMLFSVNIVNQLLDELENNQDLEGHFFYEKILYAIPHNKLNLSGFSEFETYAAYVDNKMSNLYSFRRWKNLRNGKFYLGEHPKRETLLWVSNDFNVISLEDYDKQNIFCRLLIDTMKLNKILSFRYFYFIINPLYELYYSIRLLIRNIIKT